MLPPSARLSAAPWLAVGLLLLSSSCAGFSYHHRRVEQPPLERNLAGVVVGQSDLQQCLDLLGAPNEIFHDEQGEDLELRWTWAETSGWGFFLSLPISRNFSPSLNWGTQGEQPQYLRLFFDQSGSLTRLSRG